MAKKETKEILLADYVHLNRRGYPCSLSYKHRLVRNNTAPFEWVKRKDAIYVIVNIKN